MFKVLRWRYPIIRSWGFALYWRPEAQNNPVFAVSKTGCRVGLAVGSWSRVFN
jgi:hypothetical protein